MRIQEVGECGVVGGLLGRAELTGAKSSDPGPHPDKSLLTQGLAQFGGVHWEPQTMLHWEGPRRGWGQAPISGLAALR